MVHASGQDSREKHEQTESVLMRSLADLPAWERLFKKIVWKQLGDIRSKYEAGGLFVDREAQSLWQGHADGSSAG